MNTKRKVCLHIFTIRKVWKHGYMATFAQNFRTMAILEVCAANLASVAAAVAAGAPRVELCSALEVGGVTPSVGMIAEAVAMGIKVNVLIRVRAGNFVYSDRELRAMACDVAAARQAGAHGVVIGALTKEGRIDVARLRPLVEAAEDLDITFHRAFDRCADWQQGLEDVIGLGCRRLLSSGQAPSAYEGRERLRAMQQQAAGRLIVMPGAGVTAENAAGILSFTGCHEIHASAKRPTAGPDASSVTSRFAVEEILYNLNH